MSIFKYVLIDATKKTGKKTKHMVNFTISMDLRIFVHLLTIIYCKLYKNLVIIRSYSIIYKKVIH